MDVEVSCLVLVCAREWGLRLEQDPIPIQDCKAAQENSTHLLLPKHAPRAQHEAPGAPDKSNLTIHQDQELEAFLPVLYPV